MQGGQECNSFDRYPGVECSNGPKFIHEEREGVLVGKKASMMVSHTSAKDIAKSTNFKPQEVCCSSFVHLSKF